jgi:glycosyltransferase involved in cell wall biosynthesis
MSSASLHQLWAGWARDASGFADELRGFLRAAERAGQRPALRSFPSLVPTELTEHDHRILSVQQRRRPDGPAVAIHSYVPWESQPTVEGCVNVVRAMYETDRLPERRLPLLLDRDEIWVPGTFNLESFERGGIPRERLHVLGGTLDFDLFSPDAVQPAQLPAPDDHFTFLTNFAFSERKAWRQLLHGWSQAFGPDDGVCLVLKVHSEGRGVQVRQRIDAFLDQELGSYRAERMAPIRIMDEVLSATEMPRLYAAADAYVLPTRGEGWGRPYMEAMAMGLPTIGSRWGGNMEFMNDGIAWLVDGDVVPVEHGQEVFLDPCIGHRWFAPSIDSIAEQLRAVADDPDAARAKAARARPELLERFGPEVTAERLATLTAAAYERHAERRARPLTCAIRGPFGSVSSLAVVNDALAGGLEARGHHLARHTAAQPAPALEAPTISHHWPPSFDGAGKGPSVVILPWEYGAPPAAWVAAARHQVDRVWVPSDYVRRGYVEGGMPPGAVEVVPNGVDLEHFTPAGEVRPLDRQAGCSFLFVGGTIWRKGADLLLQAWTQAFEPDDDVQLIIKDFGTQTHYRGQSVIADPQALAADPRIAPVIHLSEEVPYRDLPALYRAADVLIAPYRAEGFCLPALEAMACGLPVIHNGAGPTAEFVAADAGWALDAQRIPLRQDTKVELTQPGWAHEISVDDLVDALRAAASDAQERRARGARAAAVALNHGWDASVAIAERSLATLAAENLSPVRLVRSGIVEGRDTTVLFAPDWSADTWVDALRSWALTVSDTDPVTLALVIGDADLEPLTARISEVLAATGRPDEDLPDFAVCLPGDLHLENLVLGADAVLVDGDDPACLPAFVARRAFRLLAADPADIAAYVAARASTEGEGRSDDAPALTAGAA